MMRICIYRGGKTIGGMKKWNYGWIPHVEVVKPKELREEMKKELSKAMLKLNRGGAK